MSGKHCPDCGASGAGCGCAPSAGFDPMRIRPYVTLSDPGVPDAPESAPSVPRVVTPAPQPPVPPGPPISRGVAQASPNDTPAYDTPAYGTPVPPSHPTWPTGPGAATAAGAGPGPSSAPAAGAGAGRVPGAGPAAGRGATPGPGPGSTPGSADTVQLQAVPPGGSPAPDDPRGGASGGEPAYGYELGAGGGGGGGDPEKRTGSVPRRLLPLLLGAAAVVALGGTAMALWTMPDSSGDEVTLLDAKPSAPVVSVAPADPSPTPSASASGPSPSASRSPSPSASRSASPSASPSPSRSASPSASASPSPSASRSPSPKPSTPAQGPTLRYGDSGAAVEKLQRLLADQGLYRGKINGRFDERVERAVSTFQFENGIDDEEWGVYGPVTRRALEG